MHDELISVHPLGGCPMASDAAHGVVDGDCRVFAGHEDREVHQGLYVCDGSVMPRCLGVNPLLTISGVTERAMIKMAAARGVSLEVASAVTGSQPAVGAATTGIRFTERMAGKAIAAAGGAAIRSFLRRDDCLRDLDELIEDKNTKPTSSAPSASQRYR